MKIFNEKHADYLFIDVPDEAKNFTVINSHSYFESPRIEHSLGGINLMGNVSDYKIIGTTKDISEGEATRIIKCLTGPDGWKQIEEMNDIFNKRGLGISTSLVSFEKFVIANGLDINKNYLVVERIK
jgi:hypothetical protein